MPHATQELPGYEYRAPLHDSSASTVYRACRSADGARVVVKRSNGSAVSARQLTRYRNELKLLRTLAIDGVVKVYDLVRHEGQIALILEDLSGPSLRQWLERFPNAPLDERLAIAARLAAIVADLHAARVIHKDITSHNVVYQPEQRRCTLIDFGIATRLRSEDKKFQAPAALEGTLAYMAPEQTGRMNRSLDYRADLYSLGVTLYELLTGTLPHDSADPLEMVHFHIAGIPEPACERNPHVPQAVSDIVMTLLQKEPERRYHSAAGAAADLSRCLEELSAHGRIEPFELGAADAVDRFDLPQKLYGRAAEAKVLLDSFDRIARGGVEIVLVSGQGGIGKTSLVQEIYQPITRARGYFAAGKFDQLNRQVPFSAIVVALQDLVQQLLTESAESTEQWRAKIQAAVQSNGQLLIDVVPALELIIGEQPPVPGLDPFEAQNRFNLVFQSFVQLFCKREHPLVLFLDDMHAADPASLNLVTLIAAARATEALLLVMTYRDNEVSPSHPFVLAVQEQEKHGVPLGRIALAPLSTANVAQLAADALHQPAAAVLPLASAIQQKTGGNPFFVRQFLEALHADGLISFDRSVRAFRYDIAAVESASITENVADLLAAKLGKLPWGDREALRVAAAIGNRFSLPLLARVYGRPPDVTAEHLELAVANGLIVPISALETLEPRALHSPLVYRQYAFRHDRVQQAAYASIPESARPALHLAIGRELLCADSGAGHDARLFDVVSHSNKGRELLSRAERVTLAELNMRAGMRARNSTAYDLAVECFRRAIELLGEAVWSEHYATAIDAHVRLAESLCLAADYPAAFAVIDAALARAARKIDCLALHTAKTLAYLHMGQMPEALECGQQGAELFGVDLPKERGALQRMLEREIGAILERTAKIGVEKLVDLPRMSDADALALMPLLAHSLPAAYQSDQEMFALICCKMVSLSLDSGNCGLSARAYGSFAALLSNALGRYEDAYRFAKIGVDLCHRLNDPAVLSGTSFLWAMFASHWVKPLDESIELLRQGVKHGLQTGDHQHAGYSAARCISHLQAKGVPLAELRAEADSALDLLSRIGDGTNPAFLWPRIRLIDWLRGERPYGDTLGCAEADEAQCGEIIGARGNKSFEADWFLLLSMLRYYSGAYREAFDAAKTASELLPFAAGFVTRAEHVFFYSLILTALYPCATAAERAQFDAQIKRHRGELRSWAELCPANREHMYLLVEAEAARIAGDPLRAMDFYDRAVTSARTHGFVHIEALAAELAARFWLAQQKPDFARLCLEKALHAYDIWGARGRIADLRQAFGLQAARAAAESATAASTTLGASAERSDPLDFATLLKASQAISGEIVLDRLLGSLIGIIVENAGAESGALILDSGGRYTVRCVKAAGSRAAAVTSVPLERCDSLSHGIVNYVIRTREHVVLADPALRGQFRNDRYVRGQRPKSVLCAPIAHKGELTGVIYLENNQVVGAFTPGRLEALNVLVAQIAVSIDNATLYARQERQARQIEAANAKLEKEIAERKRAEAELSRYRDHLQELVAERTRELESAQGRLVDLSRRAGMAEVASGVLHNVGNVMNSVNVGASLTRDAVHGLHVEGVVRASELIEANADRLAQFLTADPVGCKLPQYLRKLGAALMQDKRSTLAKLDQLIDHVEHMKKIIAAQQSYAKVNGVTEVCTLEEVAEAALAITPGVLRNSGIQIVREYEPLPPVLADRHQIMQVLVNLISNAKHALEPTRNGRRELKVAIAKVEGGVRLEVRDSGIGISRENLAKIFNHGFTTKRNGHGFGLHNCANAAQQMGGSLTAYSDGPGTGASFVLRLPVQYAEQAPMRGATGQGG
jgi:predicted ATPase/signal transduction histidine kinase